MINDQKFMIFSNLRYKGMMSGLCGDFNEDAMYDFQGPKHCLYKNTEIFMRSWVSEDTDCPKYAEYQKQIHDFQKDCHKAPTHNYQPYITAEYKSKLNFMKVLYIYKIKSFVTNFIFNFCFISFVSKCETQRKIKHRIGYRYFEIQS